MSAIFRPMLRVAPCSIVATVPRPVLTRPIAPATSIVSFSTTCSRLDNSYIIPLSPKPETPTKISPEPTQDSTKQPSEVLTRKLREPHFRISFTCKPCNTPSEHVISHQAYFRGSVLVECPGCKGRHIISDHLKIFGNQAVTIEDLMKEKGEIVKKGVVDKNGDLEFYKE